MKTMCISIVWQRCHMEQVVKTDWSWARDGAAPPPPPATATTAASLERVVLRGGYRHLHGVCCN